MADNEKFVEGVAKEKIEKRIENYNRILNSDTIDKNSNEYIKAQDVIEEIVNLLKKSKPEYSFVESIEIEKQIKYYQKVLNYLDKDYLVGRKAELEKILEDERKKLEELKNGEAEKTASSSVDQEYVDEAVNDLKERIANREAMVAGRGEELAASLYDQLNDWKKELRDYENGNISQNLLETATALEIATLTERIANRKAMIAGRGDKLAPAAYEQLKVWEDKLASLKNGGKSDNEISKLEQSIAEHETELTEVNNAIVELEGRNPLDVEIQKRVVQNRIDELEDINKEKQLYKINEKGEVVVEYPDVSYEIDEEAVKAEYEMRRQDMLDKFYGNKARGKDYAIAMQNLKDHIVEKEFEFKDKDGKTVKGTYQTVEDYSEKEEDLKFMQLEEYSERLERLTKAEAGDLSVYNNVHIRDEEGKFVKLSPEEARKADEQYIESNNNAYNKLVSTRENLKTLGKYGEKVPYFEFKEHQAVRNIFRAVGNAGKFVRNHVTAPVNKFIGSKIVSPIYGKVTGADYKVAGLYGNKATHRYVARREYFSSQGKGYFSSRFNSIFKAKEGNRAVLAAGAYDIQKSITRKYTEIAQQKAFEKKTEFASKSIDEKIAMLQEDLEKAVDEKDKAKLSSSLEDLGKAKAQIARDRELNENTATAQTIQTDAVDISQHDIANKENVTRTITGVKMLTRFGIRKFVGPKMKEWLLKHTTKQEDVVVNPTPEQIEETLKIKDEKWVSTTTKQETVPIVETQLKTETNIAEMMNSNVGKQIEGYYSVYGGETKPAMYDVTGNEKITAIFQKTENGGFGMSDTSGLRAPTLTDGTFSSELLGANGVLNQDVTLEQLLSSVGKDITNQSDLSGLYVSVGDRYWAKLSDLCQDLSHEVTVGSEIKEVVDVSGHYVPLTKTEKIAEVIRALKDPTNAAKINSLRTVTKQTVENTRVTNVLRGLGIAFNGVDKALLADDIYENARLTGTDVEWQKPLEANYDAETSFTGSRKTDMKKATKKQESRDER